MPVAIVYCQVENILQMKQSLKMTIRHREKKIESIFSGWYTLTFSYLTPHSNIDMQIKKDLENLKNSLNVRCWSKAGCLCAWVSTGGSLSREQQGNSLVMMSPSTTPSFVIYNCSQYHQETKLLWELQITEVQAHIGSISAPGWPTSACLTQQQSPST